MLRNVKQRYLSMVILWKSGAKIFETKSNELNFFLVDQVLNIHGTIQKPNLARILAKTKQELARALQDGC